MHCIVYNLTNRKFVLLDSTNFQESIKKQCIKVIKMLTGLLYKHGNIPLTEDQMFHA